MPLGGAGGGWVECFSLIAMEVVILATWSIKRIGFTIWPFILKVYQSLGYKSMLNEYFTKETVGK